MQPARAERYPRIAREVNSSVTGYMLERAFVAARLAIPTAGALQVLIREIWSATAPENDAAPGAVRGD